MAFTKASLHLFKFLTDLQLHIFRIYFASSANTTSNALASNMRVVAVSATLPNIIDIAAFLDAHEAYSFDSSYRPVPLSTHVIGLGHIGKNQFLFDKSLNRHVPELIRRFSNGRPSIVFCHTKKQTESLAVELSSSIGVSNHPTLSNIAQRSNLQSLQACIRKGIAFHHAVSFNSERLNESMNTYHNKLFTYLIQP